MKLDKEYEEKNTLLFEKYQVSRSTHDRNLIATANEKLVYFAVDKYKSIPGFQAMKSDLFQEGYIGLLSAIEKYDGREMKAFSSYAITTIRGKISHYLRDKHWTVKKPRDLQELISKINKLITEHEKAGKKISSSEICKILKITPEKLNAANAAHLSTIPISLNQKYLEIDSELIDFLPVDESQANELEEHVAIRQAVKMLPSPFREPVETLYFKEPTIAATSRRLNIAHLTVARRYQKGIEILKRELSPVFS